MKMLSITEERAQKGKHCHEHMELSSDKEHA